MIVEKVNQFITTHCLIQAGDNILAACSGGPDSLALVDLLLKLSSRIGFTLRVAHVDHMFRGAASAEDAQFVAEYCRRHGIPCHIQAIDVPAILSADGGSAEDVGRRLRYGYLRRIAAEWGGAKIATGHHRDDQAETVLLHLFRGAGGAGLSGIRPIAAGIIRPLLSLSREEIDEYCCQEGLEPRLDSSNLETNYLRNRIRLRLIPYIERELGTRVREPLCRTADIIGDEQDFLKTTASEVAKQIIREDGNEVSVMLEPLSHQHIAVKRHIFRLLLEKKQGNATGITFYHVEKLIEMAQCWPVGSLLDLPCGLRAEREYEAVKVYRHLPTDKAAALSPPLVSIQVPGRTRIEYLGICVNALIHDKIPDNLSRDTAVFDFDSLAMPLYVRTRKPGDRFSPRGMLGEKKVKDYFIDEKIARRLRDKIPVFCDSQGTIIWVGTLRGSRHGQVTPATKRYLTLEITIL